MRSDSVNTWGRGSQVGEGRLGDYLRGQKRPRGREKQVPKSDGGVRHEGEREEREGGGGSRNRGGARRRGDAGGGKGSSLCGHCRASERYLLVVDGGDGVHEQLLVDEGDAHHALPRVLLAVGVHLDEEWIR